MKRIIVAMAFFGVILLATPVSWAQGDIPDFDKEAFIASAGVKKIVELGMVDCVAMALKNNSEILIKKISPKIEDANVRIEKGRFDPDLSFDFTMEDNTELSPVGLISRNPSKTKTREFNFGYDQKLVTGTELELNLFNKRSWTNSPIQNINPAFDSEAEVTITQPLLKGFGVVVNKADFLIAKNNKAISEYDFITEVINVITDVKKKYYDFQYSQEQYKVSLASLERIRNLYEINKERYAKGLASNVDLLQSESEVALAEEALLEAEAAMKSAEDNLKLATNLVDDPELWNADVRLLDTLAYTKEEVNLVEAIKMAFEHRPDYDAAKIDLHNKDISIVFYKNNMLPTLDLTGSYGLNGLGKNYGKDLAHIGGGRYPNWVVGLSVKMPFSSDEEKGKYEKSKLEKEQALLSFKRLEQNIMLEVRDSVRGVDIKYRLLEASKKSKEAEKENYAAQESRFKAGLVSTLDMVIYYERLTASEVNYIKSVIDYNISFIELAKAEGMTLLNDNITIE